MSRSLYQTALKHAQVELEEVRSKLESIKKDQAIMEQRAKMLEQTVNSLQPLCADEEGDVSAGLTRACLQVLGDSFVTVPEIKRGLEEMGVRMSSYKNPLAVLHTTLNRMFVAGQVEKGVRKLPDGSFKKTSYRKSRG